MGGGRGHSGMLVTHRQQVTQGDAGQRQKLSEMKGHVSPGKGPAVAMRKG